MKAASRDVEKPADVTAELIKQSGELFRSRSGLPDAERFHRCITLRLQLNVSGAFRGRGRPHLRGMRFEFLLRRLDPAPLPNPSGSAAVRRMPRRQKIESHRQQIRVHWASAWA